MKTPYDEGYAAGYRGEPLESNPYLKGWARLRALAEPMLEGWAKEWDRGHAEGLLTYRGDIIDRRHEACR